MASRLMRLWQPRTLLFWQMLVFNVLSSVCAWALRALPLSPSGVLLVGVLGLMNCGFGMLAAWRLLQAPPAPRTQLPGGSSASTASTSE